jgi:hypothetical protein
MPKSVWNCQFLYARKLLAVQSPKSVLPTTLRFEEWDVVSFCRHTFT